jgi:hypothetical protein
MSFAFCSASSIARFSVSAMDWRGLLRSRRQAQQGTGGKHYQDTPRLAHFCSFCNGGLSRRSGVKAPLKIYS